MADFSAISPPATGLPGAVFLANALPVPDGLAVDGGHGTRPLLVAEGLDVHAAGDRQPHRDGHVVAVQRVRVEPVEADRGEVTLVLARVGRDDLVVHVVLAARISRRRCDHGNGDAASEAGNHSQRQEPSPDALGEALARLGVLHFTLRDVCWI